MAGNDAKLKTQSLKHDKILSQPSFGHIMFFVSYLRKCYLEMFEQSELGLKLRKVRAPPVQLF